GARWARAGVLARLRPQRGDGPPADTRPDHRGGPGALSEGVHVRGEADVAAAAALLAEPSRAALVVALTEDEALPASELAARAGVAPSTASEHLRRLVEGGFLASRKNGRHRYFSLADPPVADAVDALAIVAPQPPVHSLHEATKNELIRSARTCYDDLAGRRRVALGLDDDLVDAEAEPEEQRDQPEDVEEDQRVEVPDHVFLPHPPPEALEQQPGDRRDHLPQLDSRPLADAVDRPRGNV